MTYRDILGYLLKDLSGEESEKVMHWMKDPENEPELCYMLARIWDEAEFTIKKGKPDFEAMLKKVHQKMASGNKKREVRIQQKFARFFLRTAAVLFLPAILISIFFFFRARSFYSETAGNTIKEIYTNPGTRIKLILEDSTVVWLNDGTSMKYPERFSQNERRVFVDGEAYFEVKPDSRRVFIVDNPLVQTVVTGTRFNINAYSCDRYFEATLLDGKVRLFENDEQHTLMPGQQFELDQTTKETSLQYVDPRSSVAWIEGELILQDEPLTIAVKKISRWYNLEIKLADEELKDSYITATFKDEKPEQMLRLISMAIPVEFQKEIINNKDEIKEVFHMKRK